MLFFIISEMINDVFFFFSLTANIFEIEASKGKQNIELEEYTSLDVQHI